MTVADLAYGIDAVGAKPTASTISGVFATQKTRLCSIDIFPVFTDLNPCADYIELKFWGKSTCSREKIRVLSDMRPKFSTKFIGRNCNK